MCQSVNSRGNRQTITMIPWMICWELTLSSSLPQPLSKLPVPKKKKTIANRS